MKASIFKIISLFAASVFLISCDYWSNATYGDIVSILDEAVCSRGISCGLLPWFKDVQECQDKLKAMAICVQNKTCDVQTTIKKRTVKACATDIKNLSCNELKTVFQDSSTFISKNCE